MPLYSEQTGSAREGEEARGEKAGCGGVTYLVWGVPSFQREASGEGERRKGRKEEESSSSFVALYLFILLKRGGRQEKHEKREEQKTEGRHADLPGQRGEALLPTPFPFAPCLVTVWKA